MKSIITAITLSATLLIAACGAQSDRQSQTNEWGQSVATGNAEANKLRSMDDYAEYSLGSTIDASIKDPEKARENGILVTVSTDPVLNGMINSVGQRLARSSTRNNILYTFQVVESDDINAFATMGGFVYVNKGLMFAAKNEAQLAGVMAHEIAHIASKHAIQAMARQAELDGWSRGSGRIAGTAIRVAGALTSSLPKSRAFEFQADELGYKNVREAGYAPIEMVRFYENVLAASGESRTTILSTHPDTKSRVTRLRRLAISSDAYGDGQNEGSYLRGADR